MVGAIAAFSVFIFTYINCIEIYNKYYLLFKINNNNV
jgi:hypothetical protein